MDTVKHILLDAVNVLRNYAINIIKRPQLPSWLFCRHDHDAYWVFLCSHNLPNSDVDSRIFNLHMLLLLLLLLSSKNCYYRLLPLLLFCYIVIIIIIIIYPLTVRVVGAPQLILQLVSSIFSCAPMPSGTWRTPGLSIPWCRLPTSSSVCLVFFPLSLCLARWYWPDLMNGKHDHTTAVFVSLQWSGGLRVVWLPVGSWHGLPRW